MSAVTCTTYLVESPLGTVSLKRRKVITSHSGHARFLAEVYGGRRSAAIGSIPRCVRTPYASAPTHLVYDWAGTPVIICETSHKRYEVFQVEGPLGPADA